MTLSDYTHVLSRPQETTTEQFNQLKEVIAEFPYFQSAKALNLKALKNRESFRYNSELKKTAAYTTDRSVLFDFITSDLFVQNGISEQIKSNAEHLKHIELNDIEDISVNKSVIIDDTLTKHIEATEPILDPQLFEAKPSDPEKIAAFPKEEKNAVSTSEEEESSQETDAKTEDSLEEEPEEEPANLSPTPSPEERLNIGKPLDFNSRERHSFSEWLKLTNFEPIERASEATEIPEKQTTAPQKKEIAPSKKPEATEASSASKFDLIDKFIKANPKIPPVKKEAPLHNIAKAQMMDSDALMTETLARIYLEQRNYNKAIQAYKILSLKYPEKSGFFADQIRAIKDLKKQNK